MKRYQCKKCEKSFSKNSSLNRHIESIHEERRYKCEKCEKTFKNKGNLRQHISSIHEGKVYQCEKCEKHFKKRSNLKRHVSSFHKGFKVKCPECGQDFADNSGLLRHKKRKHEKGFRVYDHTCNQCDKTFTQSCDLNRHVQSVYDGKKFKCNQCAKEFLSKYSVNRHQRSAHKGVKPQHAKSINEEKIKEQNCSESKSKINPPKMSSKPKKGMWIVKLERLTFPGISFTNQK